MTESPVRGPLDGLRILDLTTILLGPYATQILADQGADVIKIEAPEGDAVRQVGPPPHQRRGSVFLGANRNKRSLVLDLKQPVALEALARLVRDSDVFVHNMRPQAAARLGIDAGAIAAWNPRIVYCGAYGFRAGGPYADRPAYDDIIQAASGLADLGAGDGPPRYASSVLADKVTSHAVAQAITAALLCRERTGTAQAVEVTMFETLVAFNAVEHLYGRSYEPARGTAGYPRALSPHRRPHRTKDGYIGALPYSDAQWRALFEAADRPDLAEDPRFATVASRLAHIDEVYETLAALMAQRTSARWLDDLDAANVPAMAVKTLDELVEDPHLEAVDFWHLVDDPDFGTLRFTDPPARFHATPCGVHRLPPRLGQHSLEVLREAGLAEDHLTRMLGCGATLDDPDAARSGM